MVLRRSARIAAKEKKKETSQQPDLFTDEVGHAKKKALPEVSLKEVKEAPYVEIITSKESPEVFVQLSPPETFNDKEIPGNSVEKDKSKNRTKFTQRTSKEIVQHSDGSKSIFEPINLEWLQGLQDSAVDDSDKTITITFKAPKVEYKPRGITKIERTIRHNIHKTHLLTLLANGMIRNEWCNDQLTQAMACSLIERDMLALFDKALKPNDSSRGHLLITALQELCDWWKKYFIISKPGICSREYHEFGTKGLVEDDEKFPDSLKSIKSFRKSLKVGEGSRDTSAQLFVALLRSFGISARLVCSLQAVSFRFARKNNSCGVGSTDQDRNNKSKKQSSSSKRKERDDDDYNPFIKKQAVYSRKSRNVSNSVQPKSFPRHYVHDPNSPPIFWCEVYFAVHQKWLCVDPIRAFVNRPKAMEPSSTDKNNVMAYVVAFEQDGYIKDVTRRYTAQWGAKTRKLRIPSTKDGYNWWDETLAYFSRPYEREQDLFEDANLLSMETSERMPTTISAFHNHPLYALERHLKKFEIIIPKQPILGRIRGEPIYPRRNVKQLHTAETWLREGRQVMEGQQPIKHVKSRIYTMAKRRAANMAELFNEEPPESGLYGEWQTELYKPDPVVNGKVPKNHYGNVNLFKPSMCPPGGVHLPYNGIGRIAKKFGIDYGEAVVGFDFQSQRCVPVAKGVVVPEEHAEMLLEAWQEHCRNVEATNEAKRLKEIYDSWRKLILGVQIRQRLKDDYGEKFEEIIPLEDEEEEENEFYHGGDTDEERMDENDPDAKYCGEDKVIVETEDDYIGSKGDKKACEELSVNFEAEVDPIEDAHLKEDTKDRGKGNDIDMIDTSSFVEESSDENSYVRNNTSDDIPDDGISTEDEDMADNHVF
ncbi:14453_t:CDS:10 [Acaulospora morrowiae]|uniref:14453_t:CDS:1 n=1 Tax=Acaulospora morrowiae TaxID=94023 RepID=A0A9N8VC49_9GLOM|nr:14453_t:CDS:10 [Acaulospora morrowiae]